MALTSTSRKPTSDSKPLVIQDIFVVSEQYEKTVENGKGKVSSYLSNRKGEFDQEDADVSTQKERLFNLIEKLILDTADIHKKANCDETNQLKPDSQNNITRLLTNEFLFYTRVPLTLAEFEDLQERIARLAATQPENLHLLLSSFAVKTPNGNLMNVAVHIECGPTPKINLIVKNYPSAIDPIYKEEDVKGILHNLPLVKNEADPHFAEQVSVDAVSEKISSHKVIILGKEYNFSFNNVFQCETKGGKKFFTLVDICLDHLQEVSVRHLLKILRSADETLIPLYCSHILTSNSIEIVKQTSIGIVSHADPQFSKVQCKATTHEEAPRSFTDIPFGSSLIAIETSAMPCDVIPLYLAIKHGRIDLVQALIYEGADVDGPFSDGNTPLMFAISQNDKALTQLLIKSGATLYARNDDDYSAIQIAVIKGHTDLVDVLIQAEANVESRQSNGTTALMLAARFNRADIAQLLIDGGAGVTLKNDMGNTAIHFAAKKGHVAVIEVLAKNGASLDAKNLFGMSPIEIAFKKKHYHLVNRLIELGADKTPLLKNDYLFSAIAKLNVMQINFLLELGADINAQNKQFDTPLLKCFKSKRINVELIKFLIEKGANVNQHDRTGFTPLRYALFIEPIDKSLIELLIKKGAKVTKYEIELARSKNATEDILKVLTGDHEEKPSPVTHDLSKAESVQSLDTVSRIKNALIAKNKDELEVSSALPNFNVDLVDAILKYYDSCHKKYNNAVGRSLGQMHTTFHKSNNVEEAKKIKNAFLEAIQFALPYLNDDARAELKTQIQERENPALPFLKDHLSGKFYTRFIDTNSWKNLLKMLNEPYMQSSRKLK